MSATSSGEFSNDPLSRDSFYTDLYEGAGPSESIDGLEEPVEIVKPQVAKFARALLGGRKDGIHPEVASMLSPRELTCEGLPFDAAISSFLSVSTQRETEDFLERYKNNLSDAMHGRIPADDQYTSRPRIHFGDKGDMVEAVLGIISNDSLPAEAPAKSEADKIEDWKNASATAPSIIGMYSREEDAVTMNMEHRALVDDTGQVNDERLFNAIVHELTHYAEDHEGKKQLRPRVARAARFVGELAVLSIGYNAARKINIGPELYGALDAYDPVYMFASWKMRRVGAAIGLNLEYMFRPSEIRAKRAAKKATKAHFGKQSDKEQIGEQN